MRGNETPGRIVTGVGVHDVITSSNFYDCRLWGLMNVVGGQILGFSVHSRRRPLRVCDDTVSDLCSIHITMALSLLITVHVMH